MTTQEDPDNQSQPAQPEQIEQPAQIEQPDNGPSAASKPEEQLQEIIERAKTSRLSPADEDRAVRLLKQTITGGPKALPVTLDTLLSLSWVAAVKAVTEAWPETKPAGRTRLLNGLAKLDSDASRRIRLSLARGLHPQDAVSALKLVSSVCEAMGGAQGGSSNKDRQIFANVLLGKARPWLMNISLADMKPAEAHKLITPALESCAQAPVFTQIWVLRWICDGKKFGVLPPEHVQSIGESVSRWQSRWQKELRKIIPKLPDSLEAALASQNSHGAQPDAPATTAPAAPAERPPERAPEEPRAPAPPPPPQPARAPEPSHRSHERDRDRSHAQDRSRERSHDRDRDRDRPQAGPGPFDLARSLREIEAYVVRLRSEVQQAQLAARRREPAPEHYRGRAQQQPPASAAEFDDLRRFNQQLEEQNGELRQRIEELTSDHEDRAATLGISDSLEQFKTFLGLKLKEDFADYAAISREALNEVVRRHAHEILGHIFSVLQGEGVRFDQEK